MSRSLKAHILLVLATFVWGATFVVIKNALADISPLLFNAVRMTFAAAVLWLMFLPTMRQLTWPAFKAGALVGTFLWLGYEFQTVGLLYTAASKSGFLTGVSVVLVPLFLTLFWRRHINRWIVVGVGAAFVGLFLMSVPAGQGGADFSSVNLGDVLTLGCAIAFAFQIINIGRVTQRFSFQQIVTVQAVVCAGLNIVTCFAFWGASAAAGATIVEVPRVVWSQQVIWAILITGLLGTAAAFAVQAWAQQFTPPTHTALIFALEPVFAWLTSFVVLNERLGMRGTVGALLILTGVLVSELMGGGEVQELREETK